MRHILFLLLFTYTSFVHSQITDYGSGRLDTLACVLQELYLNKDYVSCNNVANEILDKYEEDVQLHPYGCEIINLIVSAKDALSKWEDIPEIVNKWWPFVKKHKTSDDIAYYTLPFLKCIALHSMGRTEASKRCYSELCKDYEQGNLNNSEFRDYLNRIGKAIESTDYSKERTNLSNKLYEIGVWNLLNKDPEIWKTYHDGIRYLLTDFYYDVTSPSDEKEWNQNIIWQIACYANGFDYMKDKEGELYDNILVYKDFLNFHKAHESKIPKNWRDIESCLTEDEAAIEIAMFPSVFLIVKKGFTMPIMAEIDSLLLNQIMATNFDDPLEVGNLYSKGGLLEELWESLKQYLAGTKRVYISGSHFFTQINYSAIPFEEKLCGDWYEIIQLTTTADIETYKKQEPLTVCNNAVIFGAIDYNSKMSQSGSITCSDENQWTLVRSLPYELRSSFCKLPGSAIEVTSIDSIMTSRGITHIIYTGENADETSFQSLDGKELDILHLSTHGFMLSSLINKEMKNNQKTDSLSFYQTIPYQSGLLMSGANSTWKGECNASNNDGILTSKEISEVNLSGVKLAVLSACDTGLGNTNNVTGISYGVHDAMKSAGVHQCLASLWKISDYATSLFYKKFYINLLECHNVPKALRLTQDYFINSDIFSNPYYWAGFVLLN